MAKIRSHKKRVNGKMTQIAAYERADTPGSGRGANRYPVCDTAELSDLAKQVAIDAEESVTAGTYRDARSRGRLRNATPEQAAREGWVQYEGRNPNGETYQGIYHEPIEKPTPAPPLKQKKRWFGGRKK